MSGRFEREWGQCRFRIRLFWSALFLYPVLAAVAVAILARRTEAPIAVPFIIAWPLLIYAAASWWRSWPCPQCGKDFFFIDRSRAGTIFGIKACHWCKLPKWAMEGGITLPARPAYETQSIGAGLRQESCWYCGKGNGEASPLIAHAVIDDRRRDLKIRRCRRCAIVHELERGMGSVALGIAGFATAGVLFARGIDPRAGFGTALLRMVPFAGLAFALCVAGYLIGLPLGKPRIWGSRPIADWEQHPEVQRLRNEDWEVFRFEMIGGISDSM